MADTEDTNTNAEMESPAQTTVEPIVAGPTPAQPTPRKRSGFVGGVLGGVLAAGAGFGAAQYVPNGWPIADTTALQATIDAQAQDIAALRNEIAQIPAPKAVPTIDLAPLTSAIEGLESRVAALETSPAIIPTADVTALTDAVAKLQADLSALQTSGPAPANVAALEAEAEAKLQEAEAQAAQIRADAESVAQKAAGRAALGRLQTAIDSGAPYTDLLAELGLSVPDGLLAYAETGLPSQSALQDSFPDAARAALEAALRADMGDTWTDRATSFFRSQTGARSLTPQEGNDPDAILSRAEAALSGGDLDKTLAEMEALPEAAQSAMADWRAKAETRQAALKAMAYVSGKLEE